MKKHTPGPWAFRIFGSELYLVADHGPRAVILGASRGMKLGLVTRGEDGILTTLKADHPDAVLIAAAPEMLAALKAAVCTNAQNCAPWLDNVEAAIAKAEGRS